jgi:hypothetical protein
MHKDIFITTLCLAMVSCYQSLSAIAADSTNAPSRRELNLLSSQEKTASRLRQFATSPDFLVKPGLLADRSNRIVRVEAESFRLSAGSPVEFPLITLGSGKDYEALAVSFASALDIREALMFIGLNPGQGVDASALRFWPRGDRVKLTFHYSESSASNTVPRQVPAERLILDTRNSKTLPESGFTFTGSEWLPALEPATGKVYAADAFSPGAIASVYNDSSTVLDIPRRASQSEVYTYQVPNPSLMLPSNQLIEVTFEPYYRDALPHVLDLSLRLAPAGVSTTGAETAFMLMDSQKAALNTNCSFNGFLSALEALTGKDRELHVTLLPDETLPLAALQKSAQLIAKLDCEQGIRIAPPPAGHPYYRAFLPDERFRLREKRMAEASEILLRPASGTTTGEVVWIAMEWKDGSDTPVFHETRVPLASPAALAAALAARDEPPRVMLVFTPGTTAYGAIRGYLEPLLRQNMILYVFAEN